MTAGGIGGTAKTLGTAEVPIDMAGVCGLCRFVMLDDPFSKATTPPLISMNLLKEMDAVLRPKHEIMTLAEAGVTTKLVSIERTQHQMTSTMNFPEEGWSLPEGYIDYYVKSCGGTSFCLRLDGTIFGYDPSGPEVGPCFVEGQDS